VLVSLLLLLPPPRHADSMTAATEDQVQKATRTRTRRAPVSYHTALEPVRHIFSSLRTGLNPCVWTAWLKTFSYGLRRRCSRPTSRGWRLSARLRRPIGRGEHHCPVGNPAATAPVVEIKTTATPCSASRDHQRRTCRLTDSQRGSGSFEDHDTLAKATARAQATACRCPPTSGRRVV